MKIGIDARVFAQGKNTGVEEFAKCFLEALFQDSSEILEKNNSPNSSTSLSKNEKPEFILFFNSWKGKDIDFSWATKYENVQVKKFHWPNKLLNFSLWFLRWPKLDKLIGGVDLFYMPNIGFSAISREAKLILTMHDLSFQHYRQSFSFKKQLWHYLVNPRLLCQKADKILAVSNFTKQDIEDTYKIPAEKITLALNGRTSVQGNLSRNDIKLIQVKEKYNLPFNFILYFGTIEPRKNIISLIKSFEILKKENSQIKHFLVIAGASGWRAKKIYQTVKSSKWQNQIIIINDVPLEDKEALFTLASVFVYPSFFEGFGFPALEAISCGVPTIVSHSSSLPEAVGRQAIMIDAWRSEEITAALKEILTNKQVGVILNKNKNRHLQKFQWRTAISNFSLEE
jgi:glycosyltransferase involved in cell wall biosynthesis